MYWTRIHEDEETSSSRVRSIQRLPLFSSRSSPLLSLLAKLRRAVRRWVGGVRIRVVCFGGNPDIARVIEGQRLRGAVATASTATLVRVRRATHNLLLAEHRRGAVGGDRITTLEGLHRREGPARPTCEVGAEPAMIKGATQFQRVTRGFDRPGPRHSLLDF